jgi:hypothetical protein
LSKSRSPLQFTFPVGQSIPFLTSLPRDTILRGILAEWNAFKVVET